MSVVRRIFDPKYYNYSPAHRMLELAATVGFLGLIARFLIDVTAALWGNFPDEIAWILPLALVTGYVAADFASGFVHWMGDTFGDASTPVLGMSFIKPFRDHHTDPEDITRHDFIEVNGNNCIVLLLFLVPVYFGLFDPARLATVFLGAWASFFAFGIFMTNQFHKWAHLPNPPGWIRRLQATGLILTPANHNVHHTAPHDTYYCITCGWLNPILHRLRFFERMEALIRRTARLASAG